MISYLTKIYTNIFTSHNLSVFDEIKYNKIKVENKIKGDYLFIYKDLLQLSNEWLFCEVINRSICTPTDYNTFLLHCYINSYFNNDVDYMDTPEYNKLLDTHKTSTFSGYSAIGISLLHRPFHIRTNKHILKLMQNGYIPTSNDITLCQLILFNSIPNNIKDNIKLLLTIDIIYDIKILIVGKIILLFIDICPKHISLMLK